MFYGIHCIKNKKPRGRKTKTTNKKKMKWKKATEKNSIN